MFTSPYVFKSKALRALKGNWQTALLVSFLAALPMTVAQLYQATQLPSLVSLTTYEAARAALAAVPASTWTVMGLLSGLSLVLTPALALGCNFYFIRRLQKDELGLRGLFSRMGSFGKALLLYLLIYVKTFLWSLLLIVPGVMAALRYSLAPFYLAEDPKLSVLEALRKSKETMRDKKLTLFMLDVSFLIWLLGAMLMETLLSALSPIVGMVASQFIQLMMATYMNASVAGFYKAAGTPQGIEQAQTEAAMWLRSVGGGGYAAPGRPFGSDDNEADDNGDADEPEGGAPPAGGHADDPDQIGETPPDDERR